MIPPENERTARTLIQRGSFSARRIAREAGISRETARRMLAGQRLLDASEQAQRNRSQRAKAVWPAKGPQGKCPTCGGRVQLPCLRCVVEPIRRLGCVGRMILEAGEEPLTIDLRDEDEERYLELRHRKDRELRELLDAAEAAANDDPQGDVEPTDSELLQIEPGAAARIAQRRRGAG